MVLRFLTTNIAINENYVDIVLTSISQLYKIDLQSHWYRTVIE